MEEELAQVQRLNGVMRRTINTCDRAAGNMEMLLQTVGNADRLLDMWTRMLSQAEYTQRLLLDERWEGASKDAADMEAEAMARQNATDRENQRRVAEQQAADTAKDAQRKAEAQPGPSKRRPIRGRAPLRGRGKAPAK